MTEIIMSHEYLMMMRQAILLQLDAIEKALGISPRTSEIRKDAKKSVVQSSVKEGEPCSSKPSLGGSSQQP